MWLEQIYMVNSHTKQKNKSYFLRNPHSGGTSETPQKNIRNSIIKTFNKTNFSYIYKNYIAFLKIDGVLVHSIFTKK